MGAAFHSSKSVGGTTTNVRSFVVGWWRRRGFPRDVMLAIYR